MKLNRRLLMVLALVMSLAMATTGTLAFLTDRDTVENTFTMGNVDIEVEEDFDQDSPLYPGEEVNKDAGIKNKGSNPAWVWMTVSIPETLKDYVELIWTPEFEGKATGPEIVDGQAVWTVKIDEPLAAGESTGYILDAVELSEAVDYQGGKYVVVNAEGKTEELVGLTAENKLVVTVNGFATQVDEFDTVGAAYEAYVDQWGGLNGGSSTGEEEPGLDPDHECWDGTSDTSWYNETDTEFVLTTSEQLAGLAELVDGGNSFAGKTIKLGGDLCMGTCKALAEGEEHKTFDPIGDKSAFSGTFDGDDHTIMNIYENGWALGYEWGKYGSLGLFGELKDATVKNLTLKGAEFLVEGGDVAAITGSATGTCVFEDITIKDSQIATYNNGCGSIIAWSGAGNYTFKNITIEDDVVLAGLWGSFDSSIGGVVGQAEPGATYNFENVDIACRLDVYNDCTASYDYYNYRMCGMIMGRLEETTTIDGVNYPDTSKYNITCSDVTVNYGDWMNYHYCEPTPGYNNGRGMRVETGYAYDGLPADYDHSQCTTNHNTSIPFDQIFGGAQLGVKGLKSYTGVTVNYPAGYPFSE